MSVRRLGDTLSIVKTSETLIINSRIGIHFPVNACRSERMIRSSQFWSKTSGLSQRAFSFSLPQVRFRGEGLC